MFYMRRAQATELRSLRPHIYTLAMLYIFTWASDDISSFTLTGWRRRGRCRQHAMDATPRQIFPRRASLDGARLFMRHFLPLPSATLRLMRKPTFRHRLFHDVSDSFITLIDSGERRASFTISTTIPATIGLSQCPHYAAATRWKTPTIFTERI